MSGLKVEKRCKAGNEDGECRCACQGVNHGLYRVIEHYDDIQITGMVSLPHCTGSF
jgi:hypothetical protein